MNRISKMLLSVVVMMILLGCSKDEPKTIETVITITVRFDDKTFGAPEGRIMLFDVSESMLESHYLSDADGMFALKRKDGKFEFPYKTQKLGQRENGNSAASIFSSYIDDGHSHLPKKMLLYVYIEKPTYQHRDMYSFIEVIVGEKNIELNKAFPLIIAQPLEWSNVFIEW